MKKFLAVLMALVLSASLFAGAMAAEKQVTDYIATGARYTDASFEPYETWHEGEINLQLNLKKETIGEGTVEYQAEPVWNVLISEDALVWDVTQTDRTDAIQGQKLTWDPVSRIYTESTEVGSTTISITPSTSFKVDTTPKTVTVTNRSNFDVEYYIGISKNFTVDKTDGQFSFENNKVDITITPVESLILESLQAKGDTTATVYTPNNALNNVALKEGTPIAVGYAFLFFNRIGHTLYSYEKGAVKEVSGN